MARAYRNRYLVCQPSWLPQFQETEALHIFLFHWNWFALWLCRGGTEATQPLLPECHKALSKMAVTRLAKKHSKKEAHGQLMLVGLMDLLGFKPSRDTVNAFSKKFRPNNRLIAELEGSTFIPGYFALRGLHAIFPNAHIFTTSTRAMLFKAANAYTGTNPALALLKDTLTGKQPVYPKLRSIKKGSTS